MSVIWILFVCSVLVLPATALWTLRWAMQNGEFKDLNVQALSIFDEDEPVGRMTDRFPGPPAPASSASRRPLLHPPIP